MLHKKHNYTWKLWSDNGFTLIELLVVIAIIAILVVIVIVAINPVGRLRDAADRTAASNVRSTGTLIQTCITKEQEQNNDPYNTNFCADDTGPGATLSSYGTIPSGVTIIANSALDQICAYVDNSGGTGPVRWQSSTGTLEGPGGTAATTCP